MKRYLVWAVVLLVAAGVAAVMIPGSPLSLQNTIGDPEAEDVPKEDWDKPIDLDKKYPKKPLRAWTADLASPDKETRLKALHAINRIAPLSANAALPVAKLMNTDPDPAIREKASHVLYRIGAGAKPALNEGVTALSSDIGMVRRNAAFFMMVLKTDARPAVPALIAAMNDPRNEDALGFDQNTQAIAAAALGGVSTGTAEAVPALIKVVESEDRPDLVRGAACRALGMIGDPAKPGIPAMTAFLKVKDLDIREDVTEALRLLGEKPPPVIKPKTGSAQYGNSSAAKGVGGRPDAGGEPKKDDGKGKK